MNRKQQRSDHHRQFFKMNFTKLSDFLMKMLYAVILLFILFDLSVCEYENTWNFYYEQPCCGNQNGHHIRHHRGKIVITFFFLHFIYEVYLQLHFI